jgi:hypothetical protein
MRPFLFLVGIPVLAHTLYVLPGKFRVQQGETLVVAVHNGDAFPEGEDAVAPERIQEAALIAGDRVTPITEFYKLGKATYAVAKVERPGSQWLVARTRPNRLDLPAEKFRRYLAEEGLPAFDGLEGLQPERYTKHAKSLIVSGAPDDGWRRVAGLELEFVPETDPSRLRAGDTLPLRVLWRGRPAAGLRVEKAWATDGGNGSEIAGRTDAEGRIRVTFDKAAKWRLHTVAIERAQGDDAGARWRSFWATLTFELPPTTR